MKKNNRIHKLLWMKHLCEIQVVPFVLLLLLLVVVCARQTEKGLPGVQRKYSGICNISRSKINPLQQVLGGAIGAQRDNSYSGRHGRVRVYAEVALNHELYSIS